MIRNAFPFILFLCITIETVFATDNKTVVFKCFNEDRYEAYINIHGNDNWGNSNLGSGNLESKNFNKSVLGSISHQLLKGCFILDKIPTKYYNIKQLDDISFYGFNMTQYVAIPKDKDRFKQVIWLDDKKHIAKLEVYDNANMLMFAFSSFDLLAGTWNENHNDSSINNKQKRGDSGFRDRVEDKYKFTDSPEFYKGFRHFHTTVFNRNIIDLSFEDGLNRFTIFIKPADMDIEPIGKIVYGNYLFSRTIDDMEYTVYGTVPYGFMESIIHIIHDNILEVVDTASHGGILTPDIYITK